MKQKILIVPLILIFVLILGQTVILSQGLEIAEEAKINSQETSNSSQKEDLEAFNKAFENYQKELETYNRAHNEYLFKKAQHERFNTLTSQQELQKALASMLISRDSVIISYLEALKVRIQSAIGVPEDSKNNLVVRLEEEIGWFNDHKSSIPTAGTLGDLSKDSSYAKGRWEKEDRLIYELLATNALGRILKFTDRTNEEFVRVRDKIEEIRKEGEERSLSEEKLAILDRWVFETEGRIARSKEKRADAEKMISLMGSSRNALSSYNQVIKVLGESQLYLKEANAFMKEIIREIKTAE